MRCVTNVCWLALFSSAAASITAWSARPSGNWKARPIFELMSLINDALKRAKESHPGNAPADSAPMQPANRHPGAVGLPVYFMPVLLATVCGAGLFLWNGWESKRQQVQGTTRPTLVVQ